MSELSAPPHDGMDYPPTVVVVHQKERRSKCTVEPLRKRSDMLFYRYPLRQRLQLQNYVRLAMDGPHLSTADRGRGLLILDATWRLVAPMVVDFRDVEPRSLPPARSAYPRTSKISTDPLGGLATVEAVYLAYVLLGRDPAGLLNDYRWSQEFLRINDMRL